MDEHGKEWFAAKDMAEVLGYTNPHKAIKDHCKNPTETRTNDSLGRASKTIIISESDVLRLINKSKLPAAEAFEKIDIQTVGVQGKGSGHHSENFSPSDFSELSRSYYIAKPAF